MIMKYCVGSPGFVISPIFSVKYVCRPHRDFDRKLMHRWRARGLWSVMARFHDNRECGLMPPMEKVRYAELKYKIICTSPKYDSSQSVESVRLYIPKQKV